VPPPRRPSDAAYATAQRYTWDDAAEHSTDPVVTVNDFEGYRIYRSTDPEFRDPRVILTGRGTGPIGNGKPIAQFDLKDGIYGFSTTTVEGVAYYLGNETGITHKFRDTTVVNGQQYYYAVCSYDYGPSIRLQTQEVFTFYPSENSITVSRTPRGGTILAQNVVAVRPNPKTLGYTTAEASQVTRISGLGTGTVNVRVVDAYGAERRQGVARDLPVTIERINELYDKVTVKPDQSPVPHDPETGLAVHMMDIPAHVWPTYGGLKRGKE